MYKKRAARKSLYPKTSQRMSRTKIRGHTEKAGYTFSSYVLFGLKKLFRQEVKLNEQILMKEVGVIMSVQNK